LIDGEDCSWFFVFGDTEHSSIDDAHTAIGIFAHEFADARNVIEGGGAKGLCR